MVLTVPMRNGNEIVEDLGNGHFVGSYRTYEEWKPLAVLDGVLSPEEFLPYL